MPARTTGMLTRKIDDQAKLSTSQPPRIGPTTMPMPETADQTAIAFGRSSSGNTLAMIDRVAGIVRAAPMPMKARAQISWSAVVTNADRTLPTPKIARPARSASRRPNLSDRAPATSSSPAKTRM